MSEIKNGRVRHEGALTGQMNLKSDLVALVAEGDVTVQGKGQEDGTRVQGLVYTKGSFKAQDSPIVGAVVSARVDGTTELDRVNMIQLPGVTDFEVVVDKELKVITAEGEAKRRGFSIGIEFEGRFYSFEDLNQSALRDLAEQLAKKSEDQRGVKQIRNSEGRVVSGLPVSVMRDFDDKTGKWDDYVSLTAQGQLQIDEVFHLDLNSFLSVQCELNVMLWQSWRQRNED